MQLLATKRTVTGSRLTALAVAIIATTIGNVLLASSSAAQAASQTGSLSGSVVVDSSEVPIANAEITFPKLKLSAHSDSKGNFQITGVPAGPQELLVRLVGYEPYGATMTFRTGQKVEADFMLRPNVTKLANVKVKATVDPRYAIRLADFEERRRSGIGKFLTADFFEKEGLRWMSQVLIERLAGVRTTGKGTEQVLASTRYGICPVQVIVNGMTMFSGRELPFDINSIHTDQVIGLEYYTAPTTPAQLMNSGGAARCGTVVIWTK